MDTALVTLIIFTITYIGVIFTRLPWVNIDRPSAAFIGAIAMILFGVMDYQEAMMSIDFHTLGLLLGMMIMIAAMQAEGLFNYIAKKSIDIAKNSFSLLIYVIVVSGIGSALFVNDAVVLMFTPIVISICRSSQLNPVPYLVAEIFASNAGSAMTITGNPQNMLIGMNSGISFIDFLWHLFPISMMSLILIVFFVRKFFKSDFKNKKPIVATNVEWNYRIQRIRWLLVIFIGVFIGFIIGKWINLQVSLIALAGGALTLFVGHSKPRRIIDKVDWILILFFASLFIVVHGLQKARWLDLVMQQFPLQNNIRGVLFIHLLSLVGSQVVSNVPFTMVMIPFLKQTHADLLWLSLASASTLAGNATIVGAMANIIVVESASREGVHISFWTFLKPAFLFTMVTLVISFFVLSIKLFI
jgi:Na+/H+ antiporter NhaD/arsenite permease-like protein